MNIDANIESMDELAIAVKQLGNMLAKGLGIKFRQEWVSQGMPMVTCCSREYFGWSLDHADCYCDVCGKELPKP